MTIDAFDLHSVLTGRSYPTGSVKVWFNEEPWYELDALEKKHGILAADNPEFKKNEKRQAELRKQLDAEAFTVHVRGISPRAGEDIISLALSELPIKRDMYGREDDLQQIRRARLISQLSFAAHITKVVDPDGGEAVFTEENRRDRAGWILGEAPKSAIQSIDSAISAVSRDFAEKQAKHTSPDFL